MVLPEFEDADGVALDGKVEAAEELKRLEDILR